MKIVIVGAKDRESEDDRLDVAALLDALEVKYHNFTVVTVMSHTGIGKLVKNFCSAPKDGRKHRFAFCEADVRVYANDLNREDMAQLYTARNAMLFEIGDLFFGFPHPQRRAVVDELFSKRVEPNNRPHRIFLPGDDITISGLCDELSVAR